MEGRHQKLLNAGNSIVSQLQAHRAVKAVVCFGSVAMQTDDEISDLDLYVFCEPAILSEQHRYDLLSSIPGTSAIEVGSSSAESAKGWFAAEDKVHIDNLPCEIEYNTVAQLGTVVSHVLANGNDPSPELAFRPYTMLGLLENSLVLFDRDGMIKDLRHYLGAKIVLELVGDSKVLDT